MRVGSWMCVAMLTMGACASEPPPVHDAPPAHKAPPAHQAPVDPPPSASQGVAAGLKQVEPSLVCMVNNQFMGKPQIPITVEGKTYFGCCEMCKGKLATDPASRAAVDPVTGAAVDKASAVIAMNDTGGVLYFENEASLARYAAR